MAILQGLMPIHPGIIFLEFIMAHKHVDRRGAAMQLGISQRSLDDFIDGKFDINYQFATTLSHFTGCSREFWINLQTNYDVALERSRRGGGGSSSPGTPPNP
jgi:addiction module HigA family antidote